MKEIILASKSIDRGEILKRAKISFKTFDTKLDEDEFKEGISDGYHLVKELAKAKALLAKNYFKNSLNAIIIAADTIIILDEEIIGKAKDEEEAFKILKKLNGRTHELITGIAITETNNPKIIIDTVMTNVQFSNLSDNELKFYIKNNEWKGRAGAYSIKDKASLFIKKIDGSYSNVIGLPMHKLFKILRNEFNFNLFQIEHSDI